MFQVYAVFKELLATLVRPVRMVYRVYRADIENVEQRDAQVVTL